MADQLAVSSKITDFTLDPVLARDCHELGDLNGHHLLLMDNSLVPWFILVPETTVTELCDLPDHVSEPLNTAVRQLCLHVRENWPVEKLNVAAIGNVVRQLHIHIVGRHHEDYCWPGVVWGRSEKSPYRLDQVDDIQSALRQSLGGSFSGRPPHQV